MVFDEGCLPHLLLILASTSWTLTVPLQTTLINLLKLLACASPAYKYCFVDVLFQMSFFFRSDNFSGMVSVLIVLCVASGYFILDVNAVTSHIDRKKKDLNPLFRSERGIRINTKDTQTLVKPGKVTGAFILKNLFKPNMISESGRTSSRFDGTEFTPLKINGLVEGYKSPVHKPSSPNLTTYQTSKHLNNDAIYEFTYDIKNPQYNLELGHSEKKLGDETQGKYYAVLPDGRKQVVQYTADKYGYKPVISYEPSTAYHFTRPYQYGDGYQHHYNKIPILNTQPDIQNAY